MSMSKQEAEIRHKYSGFLPPVEAAKLKASAEPTAAEIEAARALLAKVNGKAKSTERAA